MTATGLSEIQQQDATISMESHRRGDLTEAIVLTEMKRREIPVSIPFGDNERYDVVLETPGGELLRVQIKTGWIADGTVEFHGKSQHTNSEGNVYETYEGDVDNFLVYCGATEDLYLIPEDAFETRMSLRIEEPEQADSAINWAEEYLFNERWPPT